MSFGVRQARIARTQCVTSISFTPASASVGTCGRTGDRFPDVMASATLVHGYANPLTIRRFVKLAESPKVLQMLPYGRIRATRSITAISGCTSPPSSSPSPARCSGMSRTASPSRSLPRCWPCLPARPGRDGIASSCLSSTTPAGTPNRTWLCRMGSAARLPAPILPRASARRAPLACSG